MRNAHSASNLRATPRVLFIKHNEEGRVVALILISQDAGRQSRTQKKRKSYSRARVVAHNPGAYLYRRDLCHVALWDVALTRRLCRVVRYDGRIRSSRAPRPAAQPKRRTRVSHTVI